MAERSEINWVRIEADYRAGIKPLRLLADEHGITHGAINKRAKRDGWLRDLAPKIKAAADAKVSRALVSELVSAQKVATEREVVELESTQLANVYLSQRKDIARGRKLAMTLLAELETVTDNRELFDELADILKEDDGRRNDVYHKVMSMPGRIDSVKKLSETLKNLIAMEREAYGLENTDAAKVSTNVTVITSVEQFKQAAREVLGDY